MAGGLAAQPVNILFWGPAPSSSTVPVLVRTGTDTTRGRGERCQSPGSARPSFDLAQDGEPVNRLAWRLGGFGTNPRESCELGQNERSEAENQVYEPAE